MGNHRKATNLFGCQDTCKVVGGFQLKNPWHRKKRKNQKSLPLQAISYLTNPLQALAKLARI